MSEVSTLSYFKLGTIWLKKFGEKIKIPISDDIFCT